MLGLVVKREFTTLLGTRSMRISTAVIVALLLIAGIVGRFLLDDGDETPDPSADLYTVGITTEAAPLGEFLSDTPGVELEDIGETDPETAYNEEDANFEAIVSGDPASPTISSGNSDSPVRDLVVVATAKYITSEDPGASPELVASLDSLLTIQHVDVSEDAISANPIGYAVGMAAIMILFLMTIMGISVLSAGVVEEKSSRVVEILLTTVRPRTLLMGKILGIGSGMLVILLLYLLGMLGGLAIAGLLEDIGNLFTAFGALGIWGYVPMMLVWIILGYFTFASITGGLSATVSRQEDVGAVQTPIIFLQIIPLYVAMYLVPYQPDATLTKVLSYIPAFSPYLMPMRAAVGGVEVWEQVLAIGLTVIAIPLLGMLAGKIYERSILHVGERVKLTSVFKKAA
ncbi:MAG: ABC transporter permease [Ancrocorticia sp.]|uniref:ABC transporter permease n=1 Tax=Ancrocorticia sp. TaxID=2593684 RepID=UPI003F8FC657